MHVSCIIMASYVNTVMNTAAFARLNWTYISLGFFFNLFFSWGKLTVTKEKPPLNFLFKSNITGKI